jgi:hypothetical protein
MRRFIVKTLIRLLDSELSSVSKELLTKDVETGLLSQLWQNPAFRKYVADRNAKIVFTMAGGEGMEPEPRDKYHLHAGQRVEILLLAKRAKDAFKTVERERQAKSSSTPVQETS